MLFSFHESSIQCHALGGAADLNRALTEAAGASIVLGRDAKQVRAAYLMCVRSEWGDDDLPFYIGILSEGHGLSPRVLLDDLLWIGFNREVAILSTRECRVTSAIALDSLFRCFHSAPGSPHILVFHEIGVLAVSRTGQRVWGLSRDILTRARIQGDRMIIDFMDAQSVEIDIQTGAEHTY